MEVLLLNPTWEVSTPSVFVGGDLASGCVWGVPEVVPFLKKDFIYLFLERGEGREREREKNIDVRNIGQLPLLRAPI